MARNMGVRCGIIAAAIGSTLLLSAAAAPATAGLKGLLKKAGEKVVREILEEKAAPDSAAATDSVAPQPAPSPDRPPLPADPVAEKVQPFDTRELPYSTCVCVSRKYPEQNLAGGALCNLVTEGTSLLMRFDLSAAGVGNYLQAAAVNLGVAARGIDSPLALLEVTGAWRAEEVTWNSQPACVPETLASWSAPGEIPEFVDITEVARRWLASPANNHGLLLSAQANPTGRNAGLSGGFPVIRDSLRLRLGIPWEEFPPELMAQLPPGIRSYPSEQHIAGAALDRPPEDWRAPQPAAVLGVVKEAVLTPEQFTTTDGHEPEKRFGPRRMVALRFGTAALMKFDLASAGISGTVVSAELQLHYGGGGLMTPASVHRLQSNWGAGSVTWTSMPQFADPPIMVWKALPPPVDLTYWAQQWVEDPEQNHGLGISGHPFAGLDHRWGMVGGQTMESAKQTLTVRYVP
jgi:hypothetical protein